MDEQISSRLVLPRKKKQQLNPQLKANIQHIYTNRVVMSEGISWIAFLLSAVSVVVNIATWVWLYKYRMKLFSSVKMNGHHQLGVPCSMENSVMTNGGLGNGGSDLLSRSNSGEEYHTVPLVRIQQERNEFDDEYSRNSIYAPTANASVSFDNKNMPHQKNQALRVQSISTDEDISNADDSNNMNPIIVESDVRKIVDEQVEKLKESLYRSIVHQMTQVTEHQNLGLKQDLNSELSEKLLVQQRTITKINSQVESMSTELQNQLQGIQRTLSEENSQVRAEMTKSVNAMDQSIGQLSLSLNSKFNSLFQSLMETKRIGEEREKQHLESISALESRLKQQESLLMMIDADQSSTLLKPSYGLSPSVSQMSINTITSTGSEEQSDIKSQEEVSPQELRTNVPAATEDSYLVNPFDISGIGITVTDTGKTLNEAEESYDLSTSSSFSSDRSDDGQTTTNDDVQDEEKRNAITESVVNEDYFYESDDQPM